MDPEFAAYLERVRSHRAELGESMAALDAALALPVGLGSLWRRRVRAALTELAAVVSPATAGTVGPSPPPPPPPQAVKNKGTSTLSVRSALRKDGGVAFMN